MSRRTYRGRLRRHRSGAQVHGRGQSAGARRAAGAVAARAVGAACRRPRSCRAHLPGHGGTARHQGARPARPVSSKRAAAAITPPRTRSPRKPPTRVPSLGWAGRAVLEAPRQDRRLGRRACASRAQQAHARQSELSAPARGAAHRPRQRDRGHRPRQRQGLRARSPQAGADIRAGGGACRPAARRSG